MRYDFGPADRHAALAFQRLRFLPALLKEDLRRQGLWEDLIQEVYTAALEAWKAGMDDIQTFRHTAQRLYRFLKAYGYCRNGRKDQAHIKREIPYSIAIPFDIGDQGLPEHPFGPRPSPGGDGGGPDHERMVRVLRQEFPQGIRKADLYARLKIRAQALGPLLRSLMEQGLVHEEKREPPGCHGHPLTLVVPGPAPSEAPPDKTERIRRAYFLEGKSISQIAREVGCGRCTVRRAIRPPRTPSPEARGGPPSTPGRALTLPHPRNPQLEGAKRKGS